MRRTAVVRGDVHLDGERLIRRVGRLTPDTFGSVLRGLQEMFAE